MKLKLTDIVVGPSVQPRKALNESHVANLELKYRRKQPVPKLVVYKFGNVYKLSQGFHRIEAAKRAGLTELECEVRTGTAVEWETDALTSNRDNGLQLTGDEKRETANRLIDLHPEWTQEQVAEEFGVSQNFIGDVLADRAAQAGAEGKDDTKADVSQTGEFTSDVNYPPKPTPPKRGRKGAGRPSKKVDNGAKIGRALANDHERTDEEVAAEVGCKAPEVKKRRVALVKSGHIPKWPVKVKAPKTKPVKPADVPEDIEDPEADPRFMPNASEAEAFAEQFRSWKSKLVSLRTEFRKAFPDRNHSLANRINYGEFDATLTQLVDTLDLNIPECVCPVCVGTGSTDDVVCKYCDKYGIVDKHHHAGLKAKWKHTRPRLLSLRACAGKGAL